MITRDLFDISDLLYLKYKDAVTQTHKHKDCFISISVRYYKWYYIIAHLIALGGLVKGRNNKYSHSAYICDYGDIPMIAEALKGGISIVPLQERFYNGKFKGKVLFQYIKCNLSEADRKKIMECAIKRKNSGDEYDISTAFKAWWDWKFVVRIFTFTLIDIKKNQRDRTYKLFCTDFVIDTLKQVCLKLIERVSLKSRLELMNPAEIEPSEWTAFLRENNTEGYLALDTKKLK